MNKLSGLVIAIVLFFFLASQAQAISLINPLGGEVSEDGTVTPGQLDPRAVIGGIIKGVLGIIGSIALIIFVYGGARMIFSLGDFEKVKAGRDAMLWAAIGLVIIFSSYALADFAINAATNQP